MRVCNSYDKLLLISQKLQEPEDSTNVAAKLEAAKRRLHERYEKVESGKFRRMPLLFVMFWSDAGVKVSLPILYMNHVQLGYLG